MFRINRQLLQTAAKNNRYFSNRVVLGIETSCDETGAALITEQGAILAESLQSQQVVHLHNGGIIPTIARDIHIRNIKGVVKDCLDKGGLSINQVDVVATTVKPGLILSLAVGFNFTKQLIAKYNKPFIPIHHMEAHALTVRLTEDVHFPYLCLLLSGGHCQIVVVKSVTEFLLLGTCVDNAPGDVLDKTARHLKLRHLPEFKAMSGGKAIEILATRGNPNAFDFTIPMAKQRNCNFSFAGLQFQASKIIANERKRQQCEVDEILPNASDICASLMNGVSKHIVKRLQRAMRYCDRVYANLIDGEQVLVMSGGVACNGIIRSAVKELCDMEGYRLVCPPPKLCTDNGVMIAWNGVEKLKANVGIVDDLDTIDVEPKSPLGVDISRDVEADRPIGQSPSHNSSLLASSTSSSHRRKTPLAVTPKREDEGQWRLMVLLERIEDVLRSQFQELRAVKQMCTEAHEATEQLQQSLVSMETQIVAAQREQDVLQDFIMQDYLQSAARDITSNCRGNPTPTANHFPASERIPRRVPTEYRHLESPHHQTQFTRTNYTNLNNNNCMTVDRASILNRVRNCASAGAATMTRAVPGGGYWNENDNANSGHSNRHSRMSSPSNRQLMHGHKTKQ